MLKKLFPLLLAASVLMSMLLGGCGEQQDEKKSGKKLVIYTSMKESLIGGIVEGFKKEHPDIDIDYQSAGAGKLMGKIAAERQSGKILADVIWTSEVPDFYYMKNEGLLLPFTPKAINEILNPFDDYDGSFTAARLGTLGIVINTDKVKTPPTTWEEIASDPLYKDSFGIADPALSGTAFMSIALLSKEFGWDYIVHLRDNGASKSKGSGQVVDFTANGTLNACLGVDYIAASKIDKGAHLAIVYPKEFLMVPSPIAIFKDSPNSETAKLFVDYVFTKEAQQKVAEAGTVPVRTDVVMPDKYNVPNPETALKDGIDINYADVLSQKDEIIKKFSDLFY